MRGLWTLSLLVACQPGQLAVDRLDEQPGDGWATDPLEDWTGQTPTGTDDAIWQGAVLTVTSPSAGDVLPYGVTHAFEAEVTTLDGSVLSVDSIEWGSNLAPNWFEVGPGFETDALPIGIHDFTATATLPNGAVLQHTVGGVKVQHPFAGTFAGLLQVDGTITQLPISCIGAGLVVIERYGEEGAGEGDCLVSLLGFDVPLTMIYELEFDESGGIAGTVGVDLLGWFTYNFAAEGALAPSGTMDVTFAGDVPLMGPLSGSTFAERISLDSE